MKVLFLNPGPSPYREGFYKELSKLIDVKFLFYFEDAYLMKGIKYEILKNEIKGIGYNRGLNLELVHKLSVENYDVVVNSDPCSFAAHAAYPVVKLRKKKFVTWAELWQYPNTTAANIIKPYVKKIVKGSDLCIAAGTKAKKLLKEFGAEKIDIASNASFDVKNLPLNKPRLPKKYILQIGEIRKCDGILELIKAYKKLKTNVELVLVGPEKDLDYVAKCKEESEGWPVYFYGYIPWKQLRAYYEKCLFCMHAAMPVGGLDPVHSWEMTLNEAMSASKPLLATNIIAGAYDLIEEGKNGYMVKPNVNDLYKGMKKLLQSKSLNSMGKYSRRLYEKTFNHKNMAKQFAEALKCLNKKKRTK
ncbi:glycosyltransferase family 4 protein [Candidatus Woesearchaeota archaeon]|nr:glycosyltransferase family 4 protein [Candidatus Woesearchaeota archaeon]